VTSPAGLAPDLRSHEAERIGCAVMFRIETLSRMRSIVMARR